MGKYKSIARITATVADLTLCSDGTARMKSSITKERWQKDPGFQGSRDCAQSFGGASKCASLLYQLISPSMRPMARSHAYNHIAKRLREETNTGSVAAAKFTFEMALPALHKLDLSRDSQLGRRVQVSPIGNPLQPEGIKITGLKEAAASIPQRAGQRLECKLYFTFVTFSGVKWSKDSKWQEIHSNTSQRQPHTAWIDPRMIPQKGIALSIQNPMPTKANVLFMAVEWRQVPTGKQEKSTQKSTKKPNKKEQKAQDMSDFGIFKIAALQRPANQAHLPVPAFMQNPSTKRYHLKKRVHRYAKITPTLKYLLAFPRHQKINPITTKPVSIGFAPQLLQPEKRPAAKSKTVTTELHSKGSLEVPNTPQISQFHNQHDLGEAQTQLPSASADGTHPNTPPTHEFHHQPDLTTAQIELPWLSSHGPTSPQSNSRHPHPTSRPNRDQIRINSAQKAHLLRTYSAGDPLFTQSTSPAKPMMPSPEKRNRNRIKNTSAARQNQAKRE